MPPAPSIDPSVKITKRFTYRGVTRDWSNRYFFDNLKPADNTKWTTFCDSIVNAEKVLWPTASVTIIEAAGFDAGSDVAVFTKTYSTASTGTFASYEALPGDAAALVRYSTSARSAKNHPIYLFNYYHGIGKQTTTGPDDLNTAQKTAFGTYAAAWVAGFSDGAVTHHRCGPQGHVATGYLVNPYVRHRDFPAG